MATAAATISQQSTSNTTDSRLARSIWYMGGLMTFHADAKSTDGRLAMVEVDTKPGAEPPLHVHQNEDELFHVIEGTLLITRGSEQLVINAGESGFLPRGIPHTFKILSERVRGLIVITPGGFEEFFRAMGRPAEALTHDPSPAALDVPRMVSLCAELGVTFVR